MRFLDIFELILNLEMAWFLYLNNQQLAITLCG